MIARKQEIETNKTKLLNANMIKLSSVKEFADKYFPNESPHVLVLMNKKQYSYYESILKKEDRGVKLD